MTANLASGPLNLVKEMVFVRLYMTSKDATTLKYARGPMTDQTYRPSDDLESVLYAYRVWMYENKPDGIGTEVSTLYPIAGLYESFAEFLYKEYSHTRYGKVDRESWMTLMAKAAGGLSLVDGKLALSPVEASLVNKYDMWSGSLSVDNWEAPVKVRETLSMVHGGTVQVVRDLRHPMEQMRGFREPMGQARGFWEPCRDVQNEEQAFLVSQLRKLTQRSHVDCRKALIDSNWDFVAARELL